VIKFPNVVLGVKNWADSGNEIDLGFQKVDVLFLVVHQSLEKVARHIVFH
jgi:hypothetical protein